MLKMRHGQFSTRHSWTPELWRVSKGETQTDGQADRDRDRDRDRDSDRDSDRDRQRQ